MKSNLELLKIIKKHRQKIGIISIGLCSIARWCKEEKKITSDEYKRIMKIFKSHKPRGVPVNEHWFGGIERGKFLNKLIKKYDNG